MQNAPPSGARTGEKGQGNPQPIAPLKGGPASSPWLHARGIRRSHADERKVPENVPSEQGRNLREMNENITILLGIVTIQEEHIREVRNDMGIIKESITSLETKVDQRIMSLETKFDQHFASLETKFDQVLKLLVPPTKTDE